jgi:hypothetical protein
VACLFNRLPLVYWLVLAGRHSGGQLKGNHFEMGLKGSSQPRGQQHVYLRMVIDVGAVQHVIGHKGRTINRIQNLTGARLHVMTHDHDAGAHHTLYGRATVDIHGTPDEVSHARVQIEDALAHASQTQV